MEIRHNICSTTSSDIWFVLSRPSHVTKIYVIVYEYLSPLSTTWKGIFKFIHMEERFPKAPFSPDKTAVTVWTELQKPREKDAFSDVSGFMSIRSRFRHSRSSQNTTNFNFIGCQTPIHSPSDVLRVTARTACTCFVFFEILKRSSWLVSCEAFCDIIISGWNPKRGKISNVHRIQK